jgi:hypothetical protein
MDLNVLGIATNVAIAETATAAAAMVEPLIMIMMSSDRETCCCVPPLTKAGAILLFDFFNCDHSRV